MGIPWNKSFSAVSY